MKANIMKFIQKYGHKCYKMKMISLFNHSRSSFGTVMLLLAMLKTINKECFPLIAKNVYVS